MSQIAEEAGRDLALQSLPLSGVEGQLRKEEQKEGKEVFRTCGDILKDWERNPGTTIGLAEGD